MPMAKSLLPLIAFGVLSASPVQSYAQNMHAMKGPPALGNDTADIKIVTPPPPPLPATESVKGKPQHAVPYGPPLPPIHAAPAAEASNIVGTIIQVEGPVTLTADGKTTRAVDKPPLHLHETVSTGAKARVLVLLIDNSHVTLGGNAAFTPTLFAYDPNARNGNKIKLDFTQGPFKYAGSEVDAVPRTETTLTLPIGTVGVRKGTLWGGPETDGYDLFVLSGDATVSTNRGRVMVRQGQGTSMHDVRATPARPGAWTPERITAMIGETQIADAKAASKKMEDARRNRRILIARFMAWRALNPLRKNAQNQSGPSEIIRPQSRSFMPTKAGR